MNDPTATEVALPTHIDRFENFYIRYDVESNGEFNWMISAQVWEVSKWEADGGPVLYTAGPQGQ